jgi:phosphatidylserine decarboxylase
MNRGWPADVRSVQPGGGPCVALRMAWGRLRRAWLRRCRPGYVAASLARRETTCPDCSHDVVDGHDLVWVQNVCASRWPPATAVPPFADRFGLVRLGRPELVAATFLGIAAATVLTLLSPWLALLGAVMPGLAVWFFRDPERTTPAAADAVFAPADGVLDDVRSEPGCAFFAGKALRLGIYLSIFDVHVQRCPCTGHARAFDYCRGERTPTIRAGSTDANEQLVTLFTTTAGTPVVVRQIAGPFARRICNVLRTDEPVAAGQRFGLIKFGSRCEVWLPAGHVHDVLPRGTRVRAGETVLARLGSL